MIPLLISLAALLGINLNLAFSHSLTQPDWAAGALLAALLAHRHNWRWVLPMLCLHDIALYWSLSATLPAMALIPLAMIYFDQHLGVGLPQRLLLLLLAVVTLLLPGWSLPAMLLTLCGTVPLWYLLTRHYAQSPA